eukprot:COSAG04_NODE_14435_length_568_cov_1.051173_1_plen_75_part_10
MDDVADLHCSLHCSLAADADSLISDSVYPHFSSLEVSFLPVPRAAPRPPSATAPVRAAASDGFEFSQSRQGARAS